MAFAPTRSGKGVGLVIPTLLAWSESAVIYDIKGENWARRAGFRAQCGHLCFKFSPVEVANGSGFNPLAEVRIGTPRDVSDAQNVADMIVRTGEDSPQERYWQDAAASITTGMVLHVCYAAAASGRIASLADLSTVFTRPARRFAKPLPNWRASHTIRNRSTSGRRRMAKEPRRTLSCGKKCGRCLIRKIRIFRECCPQQRPRSRSTVIHLSPATHQPAISR